MNQETCHHELDWTAFCYAAGELSASDAAAFELRLADNQAAREALARAVEITQAVAAAETLQPVTLGTSGRSTWGKRVAWMAIGAAASLLIALVASQMTGQPGQPIAGDDGQLAAAWSQTRQELSVASDADLWYSDHLDSMDRAAVGTSSTAGEASAGDLDLISTPDWLTAAVQGNSGRASLEMPEDGAVSPTTPQPTDGDTTPFDGDSREN
jgi:hypothetical protein